MVGDTQNEVAVARNLGGPVIVVAYGYTRMPPAELGADRVIERFAELPEANGAVSASPGPATPPSSARSRRATSSTWS